LQLLQATRWGLSAYITWWVGGGVLGGMAVPTNGHTPKAPKALSVWQAVHLTLRPKVESKLYMAGNLHASPGPASPHPPPTHLHVAPPFETLIAKAKTKEDRSCVSRILKPQKTSKELSYSSTGEHLMMTLTATPER